MTKTVRPGSHVPLLTPLRADGSLDDDGLRRLVDHVVDGGCAGVLALGSAGENAALGVRLRRQVLPAVADAVGGRVQLLVGLAECSLDGALDEAEAAAKAGADALIVTPPYYGPVDEAAVERFYVALAERCPLPMLAYNIPAFTKVQVPAGVVGRLAEADVLVGVKDSGRDLEHFQRMVFAAADVPRFSVFMGSDTLILPALLLGGAGAVSIAANVVPAWTSALCDAVTAGDIALAQELQARLSTVAFALRAGVFPAAPKAALEMLGICGPTCAPPVEPLTSSQRQTLADTLATAGVINPVGPSSPSVSTKRRTT